jgi:hypothetical protein
MFTPVIGVLLVSGMLAAWASARIIHAMERNAAFVSAREALGAARHEVA